jgi:hypothetical protein
MPVMTTSVKVNVGVPPQLSEPVGLPVVPGAVLVPKSTVIFAGHVMVGGVTSLTVINCVHVAEFRHASVARYVRVITNLFAQVMLVVTSLTNIMVAVPQLSVEVTEAGLFGGTALAHDTVTGAGHVSVGGVSSKTVIVCVQDAELPHTSVAV